MRSDADETLATGAVPAAPARLGTAERHRRHGLGITAKVFLSTASVVALAIAGAVGWTSRRANQLMEKGVREAFASTQYVFDNIQKARYDKLQRLNSLVAGDPVFKAVVLETDEATQNDDLGMRRELLGADVAILTDADGKQLARTDGKGSRGADLAGWPLFASALRGEPAAGLLAQDGRLFHAVALPIGTAGEDLAGVLLSGYQLDDRLAEEMKKTTGTEVGFVSLEGGKPALAAATLTRPDEVSPLLAFAAAGDAGPREIALAGEPYLGLVSPLVTPAGARAGSLVVLRSIAQEMASFRELRRSIVVVGLVALALAFPVSFLLASRMTGPLRGLVAVAESVTDGKYDVPVPSYGGDEVGALAAAIRTMVRELKEKQELERYVASLGGEQQTMGMAGASTVAARATTSATTVIAGGAAGEPRIGEVFAGRYEILEVIGQGGMGQVYKVRDRELDEIVALKTIRKELAGANPEAAERFKQEIKLARKATHKNILRTFDFGDAGGVQYLTMEYVKGWTLRELIRRQPDPPLGIALRIARQICAGLYAAHDAGVIHRDVKSQNILIQPNGELKIMDFGIARPKDASGLTSTGAVVGTPEFIAPEQALGKEADQRSDVYSAGMVFYELFTGTLPFRGEAALEIMMKHVQETPRRPRELRPAVPAEIDAIIVKMIEKKPEARFQSFAEVYAALSRVPLPKTAPRAA